MNDTKLPKLPRKCKICMSEDKFVIQKELDSGATNKTISEFHKGITEGDVQKHISQGHRWKLMAFGTVDYTIRKLNINVGERLTNIIEKLTKDLETKNSDETKYIDIIHELKSALELYAKMEGTLINKHEIKVERSIEDALKEFLSEEDTEGKIETKL